MTKLSFRNFYHCPHCDIEWEDKWLCACNDSCPQCNREIEPYDSEEQGSEEFNSQRRHKMSTDSDLTAEELDDLYNPDGDGEHPEMTRALWREQVAQLRTISGYWDWVSYMLKGER